MSSFRSSTDQNEILRRMMHELRFLIQHIDVAELTLRDKCLKYVRGEETHIKAMEEQLMQQRKVFEEEKVKHASETARLRVLDQEKIKKVGDDSKKINFLLKENEDLKEKQIRIHTELTSLRLKVRQLTEEKNSFEKSSTEEHKQMLQAKRDLNKSEREKADLRVQISTLKSTNAQLEDQLSKAKKAPRRVEPIRNTVIRNQALQQTRINKGVSNNGQDTMNLSLNNIRPTNSFPNTSTGSLNFPPMNFQVASPNPYMSDQPSSAPPRVQWAEPLFHYSPSPDSSNESLLPFMNNLNMSGRINPQPTTDFIQPHRPDIHHKWPLKPDMKFVETIRSEDGITYFYASDDCAYSYTKLRCHCTVYVYDNRDYVWHFRKPDKLKVFYSSNGRVFQLDTPDEWNIRIFQNGHFEIHRPSQEDVSTIQSNQKRIEMISQPSDAPTFEIFESNGEAYKLEIDGTKTLIDGSQPITGKRRDGSQVWSSSDAIEYQSKDKDFAICYDHSMAILYTLFLLTFIQIMYCADNNNLANRQDPNGQNIDLMQLLLNDLDLISSDVAELVIRSTSNDKKTPKMMLDVSFSVKVKSRRSYIFDEDEDEPISSYLRLDDIQEGIDRLIERKLKQADKFPLDANLQKEKTDKQVNTTQTDESLENRINFKCCYGGACEVTNIC